MKLWKQTSDLKAQPRLGVVSLGHFMYLVRGEKRGGLMASVHHSPTFLPIVLQLILQEMGPKGTLWTTLWIHTHTSK